MLKLVSVRLKRQAETAVIPPAALAALSANMGLRVGLRL
jgi:hypothetical protein